MCCPALLRACGNHSGEAEHASGISLKLFGFIPEQVFTFIPESCSISSRNTVRNHPGIAFTLSRIPQSTQRIKESGCPGASGAISYPEQVNFLQDGCLVGHQTEMDRRLRRSIIKSNRYRCGGPEIGAKVNLVHASV